MEPYLLESYYRAYDDSETNEGHAEEPLEMPVPVLALGGAASFRELPIRDMEAVATDVEGEGIDRADHWIPEERPDYFVERLTGFLEEVM